MIDNNNNDLLENEIWKPISGYEGLYEVSDMGRVRSLKRKVNHICGFRMIVNRILKQSIDRYGYKKINVYKNGIQKTYSTHSLVAQAFLDYKLDGTRSVVCDHIDNNKLNNNLSNLQIITQRENSSKDSIGTSKYTGVFWKKNIKRWCANIRANDKNQHLGYFATEIDAHKEYQRALKEFKSTGKITRPMVLKRGK